MSEIETPELLASPPLDTPWVPLWPLAPITSGELAYAEGATDFNIPVVAQASAATVLTLPVVTLDGATPIYVEFAAPLLHTGAGSSHSIFNLWDGSTDLKALGQYQNPDLYTSVFVRRRLTPSAGAHTYSIRAYATSAVGILMSAAAGPRLPYHARIVLAAPVSTAPQGALLPVQYGTSLPTSPADGQEAILVDSLTNPTYQWRFRYNAGSTSPYKWEFVGGSPAYVEVQPTTAGIETTASTAYVALTTAGPSITVPVAGDYLVGIGMSAWNGQAGGGAKMSYDIGATAASNDDSMTVGMPTAGFDASTHAYRERRKNGLAAGTALVSKYAAVSAGTASFRQRFLRVTPIRVA